MKSKISSYVVMCSALLTVLVTVLLPSLTSADIAKGLNYDGFLTNSAGVAQSGNAPVTIRIYDAPLGGNLLFEEIHTNVTLSAGSFSVPVGDVGDTNPSTSAIGITDLSFNTEYFITGEIGTPFNTGEMLRANGTRPGINATPYAYTAYGAVTVASMPSASSVGRMVYNTSDSKLYIYNGTIWNPVGYGASITGAEITDSSVNLSDLSIDSVDTSKIVNNSISNDDIALIAGIAYSKLNLTGSVIASDIATNAAIPYSALSLVNSVTGSDIVDGSIALADIALGAFEPALASGATTQYLRGDKTFQTLDKTAVGLANVDNTSDINKAISTLTQTALDLKLNKNATITPGTKTKITFDANGLVTTASDATSTDIAEGSNLYYTSSRANTDFDTRLVTKTTDNVAEGSSNQYFTDARADNRVNALFAPLFDGRLVSKTTDDISTGFTNKFYTTSLFNSDFATKTTADIVEGSNQYFTNARARSALSAGSGISYNTTSGVFGLDTTVNNAWTGSNSFAHSSGLQLLPHGTLAGDTGKVKLFELTSNGSNSVSLRSPDSVTSDTVWTLPNADGMPGSVLSTNGSGLLAWASPGLASGAVGSLQFSNGSGALSSSTSQLFWDNTNSRLGIGTNAPSQKLEINGGHIRQFWNGNNPTYFIGDSLGVNQYGFLRWDSSADMLQIGTQAGGNTLRLSNNNRIGINMDPSNSERVNILGSTGDINLLRLQRSENTGSGLGFVTFRRGDGTELGYISCGMTSLACGLFNASDARVKENITETTTGLDTLLNINVRDYHIIGDVTANTQQGFIAQELSAVYPNAVSVGDSEPTLTENGKIWAVDYGRITPLLVKSIQDMSKIINTTGLYIQSAADIATTVGLQLTDGLTVVQNKISQGSKIIEHFVVGTVTAINGQFSNLFASKITANSAIVSEICVGSAESKTCLHKADIDGLLLQMQTNVSAQQNTNTESPASESIPAPELELNTEAVVETTTTENTTETTQTVVNSETTQVDPVVTP